eukprot:CAMPEP_0115008240 /NCGR_PEP_ID=MMETSP0216-20121206/21775_1 /TAXON_ID=223996 /ORGANISM="Protocruzia adherens, Strain Boccale" /LENGTH=355 /DNA_ID=CAMNT_0002375571 /DNA_START=77 /DNA_END=1144 /DNA_ORIENTATION=+
MRSNIRTRKNANSDDLPTYFATHDGIAMEKIKTHRPTKRINPNYKNGTSHEFPDQFALKYSQRSAVTYRNPHLSHKTKQSTASVLATAQVVSPNRATKTDSQIPSLPQIGHHRSKGLFTDYADRWEGNVKLMNVFTNGNQASSGAFNLSNNTSRISDGYPLKFGRSRASRSVETLHLTPKSPMGHRFSINRQLAPSPILDSSLSPRKDSSSTPRVERTIGLHNRSLIQLHREREKSVSPDRHIQFDSVKAKMPKYKEVKVLRGSSRKPKQLKSELRGISHLYNEIDEFEKRMGLNKLRKRKGKKVRRESEVIETEPAMESKNSIKLNELDDDSDNSDDLVVTKDPKLFGMKSADR